MKFYRENVVRKVDNLGRISLPKGQRDRFGLIGGEEVEFFTIEDDNGVLYIALTNKKMLSNEDDKYRKAAKVLMELGLEIPKELKKIVISRAKELD